MLDFQKILLSINKPPIFETGDSCIWTEDYISGQMLAAHLNPDTDAASRNGVFLMDVSTRKLRMQAALKKEKRYSIHE